MPIRVPVQSVSNEELRFSDGTNIIEPLCRRAHGKNFQTSKLPEDLKRAKYEIPKQNQAEENPDESSKSIGNSRILAQRILNRWISQRDIWCSDSISGDSITEISRRLRCKPYGAALALEIVIAHVAGVAPKGAHRMR